MQSIQSTVMPLQAVSSRHSVKQSDEVGCPAQRWWHICEHLSALVWDESFIDYANCSLSKNEQVWWFKNLLKWFICGFYQFIIRDNLDLLFCCFEKTKMIENVESYGTGKCARNQNGRICKKVSVWWWNMCVILSTKFPPNFSCPLTCGKLGQTSLCRATHSPTQLRVKP